MRQDAVASTTRGSLGRPPSLPEIAACDLNLSYMSFDNHCQTQLIESHPPLQVSLRRYDVEACIETDSKVRLKVLASLYVTVQLRPFRTSKQSWVKGIL